MALQHAAKFLGLIKYNHPILLTSNCHIRYESLFANLQKLKTSHTAEENKLVEKIKTTEHKEVTIEDVKNEVDSVDTVPQIHRRFPKSSTQNAVTSCLKPSRLASPFPEPVKMILHSETVSDEEKSRRMEEEVKLEARYALQQQQEKLLQENLRRKSNASENSNGGDLLQKTKQSCVETETKSKYNDLEDMYYNSSKKTYSAKAETNKGASRKNKRKSSQTEVPEKCNKEETEPIKVETRKGRRGRGKTRSSRLSRNPKTLGSDQNRKYSTYSRRSPLIEPAFLSPSQQIDTILNQLKLLDPKYKQIKKPLFFPGSEDEKKFYRMMLKLLSEHKHESKRLSAPYPSYSEVKTYACEGRAKVYEPVIGTNNIEPLLGKPNARSYSTYMSRCHFKTPLLQKSRENDASFLGKIKGRFYNSDFRSIFDTRPNTDNRTFLQFIRQEVVSSIKNCRDSIKKFSTSTFMKKDANERDDMELRKKKPCENPYPNIPICDYEEVARRNKERRKYRGRKPCVDGCDPCCDPCPCNPCNPCNPCGPCNPYNPCRKCSTMPVISTVEGLSENQNVINRIKEWLNTWKPESEHIKISKCTTVDEIEDRETYVIEITECADANIKDEQLKSELLHIPNMDDNVFCDGYRVDPVEIPTEFSETDKIIINNIPGYMSLEHLTNKDLNTVMLSSAMLNNNTENTTTPEPVDNGPEEIKLPPNNSKDTKIPVKLENNENQPKKKTEPVDLNNTALEESKQIPKKLVNNFDTILEETKPIQKKMVADINNILDENKLAQKKMVSNLNNILDDKKQSSQNNIPNLNSIMREAENYYFDDDNNKRNNDLKKNDKKKDLRLTDKIVEQVKVFKPINSYIEYDSNVLTRQDNKFINKPKVEPFKLKTEFWRK